jgi:hypothetical protein
LLDALRGCSQHVASADGPSLRCNRVQAAAATMALPATLALWNL